MLTFWEISDTGKVTVNITGLYRFLNDRGYRRESRNEETILYKISNHLIDLVDINDMINEIINYLKSEFHEDTTRTIYTPKTGEIKAVCRFTPGQVLEAITKFSFKRIFDKTNWNYIKSLDVRIKRHTPGKAFYYFQNGFITVTKKGYDHHKYDELSETEKVFSPLVIDRKIQIIDVGNKQQQEYARKGADFYHFMGMISAHKSEEPDAKSLKDEYEFNDTKRAYLMKLIGYCLHDFKEHGKTDFATLFCDENIGGTGKGTLVQGISKLISPNDDGAICEIDGGKSQEKYDPVELNVQTRLKVYNDITHNFLSNSVYNEITDSATIRQMYGGAVRIPYDQSWKIMILANFTLKGGDGHLLRRFRVYYMTPFFHRERTIRDYYNQTFFGSEWEDKDWNYFYNLMFECVKLWLDSDYHVNYDDPDYKEYKIESTYYPEFREYIDSLSEGTHRTKELYKNFKEDYRWKHEIHIQRVTTTNFGRFLVNYLDEIGRKYYKSTNRTEIWIDKPGFKEPVTVQGGQTHLYNN